jgi:hypothetical protein
MGAVVVVFACLVIVAIIAIGQLRRAARRETSCRRI